MTVFILLNISNPDNAHRKPCATLLSRTHTFKTNIMIIDKKLVKYDIIIKYHNITQKTFL